MLTKTRDRTHIWCNNTNSNSNSIRIICSRACRCMEISSNMDTSSLCMVILKWWVNRWCHRLLYHISNNRCKIKIYKILRADIHIRSHSNSKCKLCSSKCSSTHKIRIKIFRFNLSISKCRITKPNSFINNNKNRQNGISKASTSN